jgi:hypothetical protein
MKFTLASISTAILAATAVSGAIVKRQDAAEQNQTVAQYPNATDIGALNGTCKSFYNKSSLSSFTNDILLF